MCNIWAQSLGSVFSMHQIFSELWCCWHCCDSSQYLLFSSFLPDKDRDRKFMLGLSFPFNENLKAISDTFKKKLFV